ncbi:MAG: hypothetical protein JHC93_02585 [Parachlamydiales bacterium]|nr:hypothetical protein [Parachlamydiales bacterium]
MFKIESPDLSYKSTFENFPEEIIFSIMCNLKPYETCLYSRISKIFSRVANSNELWKFYCLDKCLGCHYKTDDWKKLFKKIEAYQGSPLEIILKKNHILLKCFCDQDSVFATYDTAQKALHLWNINDLKHPNQNLKNFSMMAPSAKSGSNLEILAQSKDSAKIDIQFSETGLAIKNDSTFVIGIGKREMQLWEKGLDGWRNSRRFSNPENHSFFQIQFLSSEQQKIDRFKRFDLITMTETGKWHLWNTSTGEPELLMNAPNHTCGLLNLNHAFICHSETLVVQKDISQDSSHTISHCYRDKMGMDSHKNKINCMLFEKGASAEEDLLYTASEDCIIKVWNCHSNLCTHTFLGHKGGISHITLTNDKLFLISCASDKTIKIWTKCGICIKTLSNLSETITCLKAGEKTIVGGAIDQTLKVWSFNANKHLN